MLWPWMLEYETGEHTPKELGVLVRNRFWTAAGTPNTSATRQSVRGLPVAADATGQLVATPDTNTGKWQPSDFQGISDCLTSFLWAHRWLNVAAEANIVQFHAWCEQLARKHAREPASIVHYWSVAQATLASGLRQGSTWADEVDGIIANGDAVREAFAEWQRKRPTQPGFDEPLSKGARRRPARADSASWSEGQRSPSTRGGKSAGKGAKGGGKAQRFTAGGALGKGGGASASPNVPPRPPLPPGARGPAQMLRQTQTGDAFIEPEDDRRSGWRSASPNGTPYCRSWNGPRGCKKREGKCRYVHRCARCDSEGHPAIAGLC